MQHSFFFIDFKLKLLFQLVKVLPYARSRQTDGQAVNFKDCIFFNLKKRKLNTANSNLKEEKLNSFQVFEPQ